VHVFPLLTLSPLDFFRFLVPFSDYSEDHLFFPPFWSKEQIFSKLVFSNPPFFFFLFPFLPFFSFVLALAPILETACLEQRLSSVPPLPVIRRFLSFPSPRFLFFSRHCRTTKIWGTPFLTFPGEQSKVPTKLRLLLPPPPSPPLSFFLPPI